MTNKNYGPQYELNRAQIQKEINANKVNIDRTVFKKTPEERSLLKKFKSLFKHGK
jgi:hypothetical protein